MSSKTGSDLFIVDNSDEEWKVLNYLSEWTEISSRFDIATGYFEVGSLLALDGKWQRLEQIRIRVGDEVTKRTHQALLEGIARIAGMLDDSIEQEKAKNDFPRIPIPASGSVFDALAALGEQFVQWHLLEHPTAIAITTDSAPIGVPLPAFEGTDRQLLKVAEKGRELADLEVASDGPFGTVRINPGSGFTGVRQVVWQHTIGGYQVLHKWLDDRRKAGRSLSDDDIAHWRRVYAALDATQRLTPQIDEAIVAHGGWPAGDGSAGAFSLDHPPPDPVTLAADTAARPKGRHKAAPATQTGFGFDSGS